MSLAAGCSLVKLLESFPLCFGSGKVPGRVPAGFAPMVSVKQATASEQLLALHLATFVTTVPPGPSHPTGRLHKMTLGVLPHAGITVLTPLGENAR